MKRTFLLIPAVLLLLSAVPGPEKPNFLLVTIDTWRADYISASGSGRVQTPFLDKLAREGSYIKRIDAPAPLTTPSHASIMTGLYPKHHSVRDNAHFRLKDGVRTMAQVFKDAGYQTIGVVSAAPLRKNYGLNRGFDVYDDQGIGAEGDEALVSSSRDARDSAARALKAVRASAGSPIFLWLHLYDPHYPYAPPSEFRSLYQNDLYAGEVAYVDKVLGDLVPGLLTGKKGRWIVAVTGDHGEGLGEKGEMTHGVLLYRQTREVPFILWDSEKKTPGFGAGSKSLVDIFPTVMELFSLPAAGCDGVSLFKGTSGSRWLFSEAFGPLMDFGLNPAMLARQDENIFIKHGTSREVYRLADEDNNLAGTARDFVSAAEAGLKKFYGGDSIPSSNMKLTEEEIRGLDSLGYIAISSGAPHKINACDLREFCRDFTDYYSRADEERARGRLEQALDYYNRMTSKYPGSPLLHVDKGYLLMEMKRSGEAKEEFLACLKLDGGNCNALLNLGDIMDKEGRFGEAEKYYRSALNHDEGKASAHFNLGIFYAEHGNSGLAIKHLERFAELAPGAPQTSRVKDLIKTLKGEGR